MQLDLDKWKENVREEGKKKYARVLDRADNKGHAPIAHVMASYCYVAALNTGAQRKM